MRCAFSVSIGARHEWQGTKQVLANVNRSGSFHSDYNAVKYLKQAIWTCKLEGFKRIRMRGRFPNSFPSWSLGTNCFPFTVTLGRCDPRWVTLAESDFALHKRLPNARARSQAGAWERIAFHSRSHPAGVTHGGSLLPSVTLRCINGFQMLELALKLELGNELLSIHGHTRQV